MYPFQSGEGWWKNGVADVPSVKPQVSKDSLSPEASGGIQAFPEPPAWRKAQTLSQLGLARDGHGRLSREMKSKAGSSNPGPQFPFWKWVQLIPYPLGCVDSMKQRADSRCPSRSRGHTAGA